MYLKSHQNVFILTKKREFTESVRSLITIIKGNSIYGLWADEFVTVTKMSGVTVPSFNSTSMLCPWETSAFTLHLRVSCWKEQYWGQLNVEKTSSLGTWVLSLLHFLLSSHVNKCAPVVIHGNVALFLSHFLASTFFSIITPQTNSQN